MASAGERSGAGAIPLNEHFFCEGNGMAERSGAVLDGRERIQPKYKGKSLLAEYACEQAYYQVFVNEMPGQASSFIPNLSILDLLSAEGPNAASFLRI